MGILDGIVDWLATQVMNLLDLASTSVLGALGCNMDTFKRYFPAASAMYEIFIWTAIGLVLLNLVWQLYRCYGAGFDIDTENPINLVVRSVIFLLLIWYCDDIVNLALRIGGTPYNWILDSTLPGVIRAVVSEDVHSFDGTRVLIPRGAQLIGRYRSDVSLAQSRVMVGWDRIILPDNQTVAISAFGGDELGRSGVTGDVDTRFGQRFGSAALISLIGAVPAAAAASIDDEATSDAASDVAGDLRDASRSVMQEYLSIRPVIRVPQGTRITVMVDRDLEIF